MTKSEKKIKVKPSKSFVMGSTSIRHIVGAERDLIFNQGEIILISEIELDCLEGYGWVEIISTPQKEVSDVN